MPESDLKSVWTNYKDETEAAFNNPEVPIGPWTSYNLMRDPRHNLFVLARYKFCAKMLEGKDVVVEVGCGDGFGIPIIAQAVKHLHCIDWDERNLEGCARRLRHLKNVTYEKCDLNSTSLALQADALFSADVIEHIEPKYEDRFMKNLCSLVKQDSVLITGTPNIHAEQYASKNSKLLHINLKSPKTLKELTLKYFKHEFSFGMNDEILHTGFGPMCHYLWSIGVEKRI
jgi:2-polyprenyl-3-methyl-5-hydroxy-6-metoxy-1,4-benzoquinol methylase